MVKVWKWKVRRAERVIWIIPLVPISVLVRPIRHLSRVMITVDIWDSALCHSLC